MAATDDDFRSPARRVLIVAPTRKDGEFTRDLLTKANIVSELCVDLRALAAEILAGAGAILMTERFLTLPEMAGVMDALGRQEDWSDLPIVLLLQGRVPSAAASRVLAALRNVTLLERPAPTRTVVSAVEAALRARRRQYQIRDQFQVILAAQDRFQAMANSLPQLAWMAHADGSIFWFNRRWHEYRGTTEGAGESADEGPVEAGSWTGAHDAAELARVLKSWRTAIERGEPWEDTFLLQRSDGELRWHLSQARPYRNAAGEIVLWFGTHTDVTDERERADQRQRLLESEQAARREAERAGRMKDEFLSTLSHELRTPLSAIFGWTQLLKLGPGDPATVAEAVEVIDRNVRAQTQLIDDLLDMSRIISGKVRLDVRRVDPAEVIHAALEVVKPAIDAKGIRLERVVDSKLGEVSGDFGRLQQVFWNLLTNAIKFTPKGGRIHVLAERVDSHVEISVTDTGEGIEPDFLPHLFERFSQADASTTRRHGGLGLGLSIVRNLVELHGGTINAASGGLGQGAAFVVRLPVRVAKSGDEQALDRRDGPREGAGTRESLRLRGVKVLVVDDEADARELLKRFLQESEAIPVVAASVAEGERLLTSFLPDVIVSDIGMPGRDGYDFLRTARANGVKVPAIALTAFARAEDRIRSLEAGYQAHLAKPVEPTELLATIAGLASR